MPPVVLYFQVHQPNRLRRYSVFDSTPDYFDDALNAEICRKVAEKCYRPATRLLLELVRRYGGAFRVAFSFSGTVLEQWERFTPDVTDLFRELCASGHCEVLSETSHHSLAFLYSRQEFQEQLDLHDRQVGRVFGVRPRVFRHTELIYSNDLAHYVAGLREPGGGPRYLGCVMEGAEQVLGKRSPNHVYKPPHTGDGADGGPFALLLRNYALSDDVAFRFSNREWAHWPLTADTYAAWISELGDRGAQVCNIFVDYETFGEHQWAQTGIFGFLEALPGRVLAQRGCSFLTPSQGLRAAEPAGTIDAPRVVSWADTERDLSAWLGNAMQSNAMSEVFRLERAVKRRVEDAHAVGDETDRAHAEALLNDWRRLTSSDHYYYMSTKYWSDGAVHKYFSPYESPYDAYINLMNVLDNLRVRCTRRGPHG